jgi:hypothetical protein
MGVTLDLVKTPSFEKTGFLSTPQNGGVKVETQPKGEDKRLEATATTTTDLLPLG